MTVPLLICCTTTIALITIATVITTTVIATHQCHEHDVQQCEEYETKDDGGEEHVEPYANEVEVDE